MTHDNRLSRRLIYLPLGAALFAPACADPDAVIDTDGVMPGTTGMMASTTDGPEAPPTTGAPTTTGDEGTTGEPADCYSTRDFFADVVWAKGMGTLCVQCHEPTGAAAAKGAKFRLLTPVYPGFIEANLANIDSLAAYQYDDVPLLLAKPTGLAEHRGGLEPGDSRELYVNLEEMLAQLDDRIECAPPQAGDSFPDVLLLHAVQTLRKAALHLVG